MRIDHLGIAVRSVADAAKVWGAVGLTPTHVEDVSAEGVRVAFLPIGDSNLELLEPLAADGVIARFLATRGEGLHHVALAVDDVRAAMQRARNAGLAVLDDEPRQGARGRKVAFVHPKSAHGVLLEFVENAHV